MFFTSPCCVPPTTCPDHKIVKSTSYQPHQPARLSSSNPPASHECHVTTNIPPRFIPSLPTRLIPRPTLPVIIIRTPVGVAVAIAAVGIGVLIHDLIRHIAPEEWWTRRSCCCYHQSGSSSCGSCGFSRMCVCISATQQTCDGTVGVEGEDGEETMMVESGELDGWKVIDLPPVVCISAFANGYQLLAMQKTIDSKQ